MKKSLIKTGKTGFLYFIGNAFDKAVAFLTIPIFTKLLSTEEYGITTTYLAWVGILSVVITLSLGNSIRAAVSDFPNDENRFISSIFFLGTISATASSSLIILFSYIFGYGNYLLLIACCCIHSYSASILQAIQLKHLMKVEYVKRTVLQSLPNLLVVGLSILFIFNLKSEKYYGRVLAYTIVFGLIAFSYVVYYFFKGKTFFNKQFLKYALKFSLPVIIHSLSTVVLSQSDRIMINTLYSSSEAGIYGLAYQFGMLPLVITTTLESLWIPWFTEKMKNNDYDSISKMTWPYIIAACISCVCIMLVSPEVLKFMSSEPYYGAVYMIPPVITASFFMFLASISIDFEYYYKDTKTIAINTIIAATLNILLNLWLIPKYGGVAAAYTTVFSYFASYFAHFLVTKRKNTTVFPIKPYLISACVITIFTLGTILLMKQSLIRWVVAVSLGVLFVVFIFLFYKKFLNEKEKQI